MAYTTLQRVQRRAGAELTSDQLEEAARLIPAAEAFIDQRTGTTWGAAATAVSETQRVYSQRLRLRQPPVASVTSVALRRALPGYQPVVLAPNEYELAEPELGLLLLPAYWGVSGLAGGAWATWYPPGGGAYATVAYERAALGTARPSTPASRWRRPNWSSTGSSRRAVPGEPRAAAPRSRRGR